MTADEPAAKKPRQEAAVTMSTVECLGRYYSKLFPFDHMSRWLSYGNDGKHAMSDDTFFRNREFCYTLDGDIFVRYQSFQSMADMKADIEKKCKGHGDTNQVPVKIDIGPVYTREPRSRQKYAAQDFRPVERELVFDIDMDGYDDVRRCCQGSQLCDSCWPLLTIGVQLMDQTLREDFGFANILWVYSGRRGIHGWVCDAAARRLTDEQRAAVASYLEVYKGNSDDGRANMTADVTSDRRHPAVARAVTLCRRAFEEQYLPLQGFLEDEGCAKKVLSYVPDANIRLRLVERWGKDWNGAKRAAKAAADADDVEMEDLPNLSVERWKEICAEVRKAADKHKGRRDRQVELLRSLDAIAVAYTYPRLDIEVSKKMNHLLKAPFCVHPKTGRVCVPIDPARATEFSPEAVPTVQQLLKELEAARRRAAGGDDADVAAGEEWRATAMGPIMETFERVFLEGMMSSIRAELAAKARERAEEAQAAQDW
ncbi:unnamed protein product [Pedinophyceae sp. YPF-701]|nr:unnamed protein product [Pedinophyceae sp. YPF-701]